MMVVPSADNHVLATRLLPRHRKAWIGALAFTAVVLGIGAPVLARPTHTAVHTAAHTAAADKTATSKLPIGKAVVLGLVEGVTEFLPVSSTGHLLVAERLMDVGTKNDADKKATDAYTVIIQLGAILAVLLVSWKRVLEVLQGLIGKSAIGRRLLIALICAFVPAAAVGVLFNDAIDKRLLKPTPVALAWLAKFKRATFIPMRSP